METKAIDLTPGDIVMLKHGAQAVSHSITYPSLSVSQPLAMIHVFFVGQSYPLLFREDYEVDVIKHINIEAVRYAAEELSKR